MKTDTEDEWEKKCRIEVQARDKKTAIFGNLSDRNLRGYMTNHLLLMNIDGDEDGGWDNWAKILAASLYAAKIRELIGLNEPDYTEQDIPATLELNSRF